jgi:hypothetical protein
MIRRAWLSRGRNAVAQQARLPSGWGLLGHAEEG